MRFVECRDLHAKEGRVGLPLGASPDSLATCLSHASRLVAGYFDLSDHVGEV